MTLDDAIAHAREIAAGCGGECADEHAQLAEWLEELRDSVHGTLTAEQVRNALYGHYELHMVLDVDGFDTPQVTFDWQAIADELNTTLGGGECEMKPIEWHGFPKVNYICSACDASVYDAHPNFCPNCGKAVKR